MNGTTTPACDYCGDDLVMAHMPDGMRLACCKCSRLVLRDITSRTYEPAPPPVEPVQCRECPRIEDAAAWIEEANVRIRAERLCLRCMHWTDHLRERDAPEVVRAGGRHHRVAPDLPRGAPGFRGHGGAKVLVRFHDGRVVVSRNLWSQGRIPSHFRARMPDNATFLTSCTYCDQEATGSLSLFWGTSDVPSMKVPHCGGMSCGAERWGDDRVEFVPAGATS